MKKTYPIFKGRLLNLSVTRVKLPNGFTVDLEVIEHPGAALVVPLLGDERVILIRQFRPVIQSYLYELPAGTLKKNETPLDCARREIIEETGFAAGRFIRIGQIYPVPGYSTEKIIIYRAQSLRQCQKATEQDEVIRTCILKKHEVKRLFKTGKITDAKTICALSMCGWLS